MSCSRYAGLIFCCASCQDDVATCGSEFTWFSQAAPELLKLFGEDPEEANMSLFTTKPAKGAPAAPTAQRGKIPGMDTPRGEEEELTEEELLHLELEKVKHEREVLMQNIANAKGQAGAWLAAPTFAKSTLFSLCLRP